MARCGHSDLVKKKKNIVFFFWCLTYQTDVAVCVSVTPLKIGAKHRRSHRPCWRAGPMTTWLTLTITWTIWGTTGPTLWSTSPSWICANSQKHTAGGGARTQMHTPTLLPFQHAWCYSLCSTEVFNMQPLSHPETCVPTGTSVALTDYITESRASAAHALLACVHFKRWRQDDKAVMFDKCKLLTWHFFCFDFCNWLCFLRFVG